ncbi:Uncharacterized protein TCAP_03771 [Tolypocladium capitatum]|uniref:Alpha-xylosidase n=1 Tax=Tolypocladium capitatum TaxID=45235 RepID=A0A2K3QFI1_9HYPO|nr:Uncharacterized protein TCAP_03771 [Tolypocladium capitatum]
MEAFGFPRDPVANAAATVAGPNYRFTVISDIVTRFEWSDDGRFEDRPSAFAVNRNFPAPPFKVGDANGVLEIRTPSTHIVYDKKRFSPNGLTVSFSSKVTLWGAEWRYGQTPRSLGGTARTLDEVDGRCDMGSGILSREGYSFLDDSDSMLFDAQGAGVPRRAGDRIDGYLFCYGHDYRGAMRAFYSISGHQPALPRWTLGNWWSRYYAYRADEYVALMDVFREQGVPLSVAVIDMDWHVVRGERVPHAGWTGYSWNKSLFPDPAAFCGELHRRRLKITLNDHPHAGVHHHEDLYEDMAKAIGHDTADKAPILFDPTDPKFMQAYLDVLHRSLERDGCDFWWIDWQQGPYSRIPGLDPLWLLNHFHFLDQQRQGGQGQALIFSRYAGPGSHRYPVGFSGDSVATWESLRFQPEFTATASNIGYGWWSHDIGGHMHGYRDDELATRWLQYGAFSPILRLHSSNSPWASKEPWLYRAEYAAVMCDFLRFRHRLVPYLYTMNVSGAVCGEPLVQPLYWRFPSTEAAYDRPNEYYFGSNLVVAPIVRPRDKRTNLAMADVWVPPGRHVDVFTGLVYDGNRNIQMYRNLQAVPLLAPEGSIIPLDKDVQPANGCANPQGFEVYVVVGGDGEFTILEDLRDDSGQTANGHVKTHREIKVGFSQGPGRLTTAGTGRDWVFRFLSLMTVPDKLQVTVNGSAVCGFEVTVEEYPNVPGLVVKIPGACAGQGEVAIDLGPQPQPSVLDVTARLRPLVLDFQIEFTLKDKMWEIIESAQPLSSKIGCLMGLDLDSSLVGPLLEVMVSDGRQCGGGF